MWVSVFYFVSGTEARVYSFGLMGADGETGKQTGGLFHIRVRTVHIHAGHLILEKAAGLVGFVN